MRPWNAACLLLLLPASAHAGAPKAPLRLQNLPTATATVAPAPRQPARLDTLSPSLRQWVVTRARATVQRGGEPDMAAIEADARVRLAGQSFGDADVMALAFLVMMEASRQAREDLREIMSKVQDINHAKTAQRESASQAGSARAVPPRAGYGRISALATPSSVASAAAVDGIGGMGQEDQLQLQMAMDRKAKIEQALSNVMKKTSDTAATIASNLK